MQNTEKQKRNRQRRNGLILTSSIEQSRREECKTHEVTQLSKKKVHVTHLFSSNSDVPANSPKIFEVNLEDQSENNFEEAFLEKMINASECIENHIVYKYFNLFIMLVFLSTCILQSWGGQKDLEFIGVMMEKVCQGFFSFFFFISLLSNRREYFWLLLDIITIATGITGLFIQNQEAVRFLKALRTLKILFFIKIVDDLKTSVEYFMHSLKKVFNVLISALFFIYLTAVIGLFCFVDLQYQKCRHPMNKQKKENWSVYEERVFLCGEKQCPIIDGVQFQCLNPIYYNVQPNKEELNNFVQGYGLMNYSNIFYAIFSTFKQIFVTGSSRLIILYKQSLNIIFVSIYFFGFIYFMPYIYFNIFYGLLITAGSTMENKNISELSSEEAKQYEVSSKEREERKDMENFTIKISSVSEQPSENVFHFEVPRPKIKMRLSQIIPVQNFQTQQNFTIAKYPNIFEEIDEPEIKNEDGQTQNKQEPIGKQSESEENIIYTNHIIKTYLRPTFVTLCVINLSLDFEGQSKQFQLITDKLYFLFYFLHIIATAYRVFCERKLEESFSKIMIADITLAVLLTVGVIYEAIIANDFEQFLISESSTTEMIRCLIYCRVFICFFEIPYLGQSAAATVPTLCRGIYEIRHFIIVWFIVVLTLSLMGFHLHHGKSLFDENGQLDLENGIPARISLSDFYHSFVFTALTVYNQEWDILMFQEYRGCGVLIVIWQLITLIVGMLMFSKYLMCLLAKELDKILEGQNQNYKELCNSELQLQPKTYGNLPQIVPKSQISSNIAKQNEEQSENCTKTWKKTRLSLRIVLESQFFMIVKSLVIFTSCFSLAYTNPTSDPSSESFKIVRIFNMITHIFFFLEFLMNSLAYGWIKDERSYFRASHLNKILTVVIIIEMLYFTPLEQYYLYYRFYTVRALRSLHFLECFYCRSYSMRITVRSLVKLIPQIFKLLFFSLMIYYFFALVLTKLYKEDYYYCANEGGAVTTKEECLLWGGDWVKRGLHFATPLHSLLYLFLVATMEGWIAMMGSAMDMAGAGRAPSYNSNEHVQLFFLVFFLLGNLLVLNSFVSLSLFNYKRIKERETGEWQISAHERTWLSIKLQILRLTPTPQLLQPENFIRKYIFRLCRHRIYTILKSVTFLSMIITVSFTQTQVKKDKAINSRTWDAFILITIVEYVLEFIAFGFRCYNKVEFIFQTTCFLISLGYFVLWRSCEQADRHFEMLVYLGGVFMLANISRYIKLLDQIPFTSKILNSILTIIPRTVHIFMLIILMLYLYAVIGMELFAFLRPSQELDEFNQNYQDMSRALFSLVKFSLNQAPIAQIIDSSQAASPDFICFELHDFADYQKYGAYGCGSKISSYIFFLSFHIFYSLILMSTFLALVVDAYDEVQREESAHITKCVLKKVITLWTEKDPEGTGFAPYREFWMLSTNILDLYLRYDQNKIRKDDYVRLKMDMYRKLDLQVYENQEGLLGFEFYESIESITKLYLERELQCKINEKRVNKIFEKHKTEKEQRIMRKTNFKSKDLYSLILLKSGIRRWKHRATKKGMFFTFQHVLLEQDPKQRMFIISK